MLTIQCFLSLNNWEFKCTLNKDAFIMKPEQTVIFSDFNVCIFSIYSTVKNNLPLLVSLVQLNICNSRGGWGGGGGAKIQQFQKLH